MATDSDEFNQQFRELLADAKKPAGIVYVWRATSSIPRLKGESPIVYIGKTDYSLYDRYNRYVDQDTGTFWDRYDHIMSKYGGISIDIYETSDPKKTENDFLYQYRREFLETPPLNTQSYKVSLLDQPAR